MNMRSRSESTEDIRHIDIVVTTDSEQLRELEDARLRAELAEEAAARSAAGCNTLLAMGIGLLLGGLFFGGE